jgi:hypothetical protein
MVVLARPAPDGHAAEGPPRSPSPADLWPVLDERFRSAVHDLSGGAAGRVFGDVPGATADWMPARPFFMDVGHYREFARITGRLAWLVLQSCRRRASTVGELSDALELDPANLPLLDLPAPLTDDLLISLRPDAVYHDGVPKFLELNIDGAVGGAPHVDVVSARFLAEYEQAGIGQDLQAADPSIESRFAALSGWLGRELPHRLVIPVFPVGTVPGLGQDPDRFIAWLAPWCETGRRYGIDTVAVRLEDLRLAADGRLLADAAPVDAVLRLFLHARQPASAGRDAFAEAVLAGKVAMHTPEAAGLLMNKRTLAWLWSDLDQLAEPDQRLVADHVPFTLYFPAGTGPGDPLRRAASAGRAGLVLKPGHGYSGTGVTVGPAVAPIEWEAALDQAAAQGGFVLQDYVAPDTTPMDFVHRGTGEMRSADVSFVAGPFLFGGRPSGMLVRHSVPDGGAVLNAGLGAVISTALMVDRRG